MFWPLKNLPQFSDVSRNDARRVIEFARRHCRFSRKMWLSAFVGLPPMCIAHIIAIYYFREQFIIRSCVVVAGIFIGMFLSNVVANNTLLRRRIHEVMNNPQQLDSALHDESHLADRFDSIVTIVFVGLVVAGFFLILWSASLENSG